MLVPEGSNSTMLPREVLADRVARRTVRDVLGDAPIAPLRDTLLLTSELVTNAIRHTAGEIRLTTRYWPREARIRVEIADESTLIPELPPRPQPGAASGRGLRLVDDISAAWGALPMRAGKCMWFEICW
jgi:anti-sigma regulatory factor (Ser/Thr protein kinase)